MTSQRRVRCSECGKEIFTMRMASPVGGAPVVCRKCFGEQSYKGGSRWISASMSGGAEIPAVEQSE